MNPEEWTFGPPEAPADFFRTYPSAVEIVGNRLGSTMEKILGRRATVSGSAQVIYCLAALCASDFQEILVLCENGLGIGALKILRGMYERAVTVGYLVNYPAEAELFVRYGAAILRRKELTRAKRLFPEFLREYQDYAEEIEKAYTDAEPLFREPLCKECGTTRPMGSWTKLSIEALAHKAGVPGKRNVLAEINLPCYFDATMQHHPTLLAIATRFRVQDGRLVFSEGVQRDRVDTVFQFSHLTILAVLESQNRFFNLGLEEELSARGQEATDLWSRKAPQDSSAEPP